MHVLSNKFFYKEMYIGDKKFIGSLEARTDKEYGFFEVLFEGSEVSLLKKYKVYISEGRPSTGMTPAVPDKFVKKPIYYYLLHNSESVPVYFMIRKNQLLSDEEFDALEDFVKDKKIRHSGKEKKTDRVI